LAGVCVVWVCGRRDREVGAGRRKEALKERASKEERESACVCVCVRACACVCVRVCVEEKSQERKRSDKRENVQH